MPGSALYQNPTPLSNRAAARGGETIFIHHRVLSQGNNADVPNMEVPPYVNSWQKYQIILHEIDGNSTWIEPMKNKAEGGVILARRHISEIMK